jgi:hypothetical protein
MGSCDALQCSMFNGLGLGSLSQVRAILHCDLGVVTASRDKTAKIWVSDGPCAYSCLSTLVGGITVDVLGCVARVELHPSST